MAELILITGGNLGDVAATLMECNTLLEKNLGEITKQSKFYTSKAWGFECEDDFINQVLVINTDLSPEECLAKTQKIEKMMGRVKNLGVKSEVGIKREYFSRNIDIDILFYDDKIINLQSLTVPHPLMQERMFVLEPLAEVVPEKIHPVLGLSIEELKRKLEL